MNKKNIQVILVNPDKKYIIKNVKRGYFLNYLFPKKIAKIYNENNIRILEIGRKKTEEKREEELKKSLLLEEKIKKINLLTIELRKDKNGIILNSLTSQNIVDSLKQNYEIIIEKKDLLEFHSINSKGESKILIRTGKNRNAELKIFIN